MNFCGTETAKWMTAKSHLIKSIYISIYGGSRWLLSLIQRDAFVYLLSPIMQGFPLGSSQYGRHLHLGGRGRVQNFIDGWKDVAGFHGFEM